jgi:hypothetical protein
MADGKIKISELEEALQLNDNAEFPYSQDNGGVPTTFKAPANQIARKVAEGSTFTNLTTTAKTLVGAINELSHLGNPIIIGTTAPTSSQGADGNIYVQYTAGTGGADDEVDGIFVKIDGAWCEIQTGGGSGTTDYEDLSNKPQVNSVELVGNKSLDDLGIMPALLSKTVSGAIAHFTDGADNIPQGVMEVAGIDILLRRSSDKVGGYKHTHKNGEEESCRNEKLAVGLVFAIVILGRIFFVDRISDNGNKKNTADNNKGISELRHTHIYAFNAIYKGDHAQNRSKHRKNKLGVFKLVKYIFNKGGDVV